MKRRKLLGFLPLFTLFPSISSGSCVLSKRISDLVMLVKNANWIMMDYDGKGSWGGYKVHEGHDPNVAINLHLSASTNLSRFAIIDLGYRLNDNLSNLIPITRSLETYSASEIRNALNYI